MKLKTGDYLIFLCILIISVYLISKIRIKNGNKFIVNADGNEYEYSLLENRTYEVSGRLGITKIEVNDGRVRIVDSPCKNKTCIHQGWGKHIICLPNDVIITVVSGDDFDAIAQ